jgi:hypothetical protein
LSYLNETETLRKEYGAKARNQARFLRLARWILYGSKIGTTVNVCLGVSY